MPRIEPRNEPRRKQAQFIPSACARLILAQGAVPCRIGAIERAGVLAGIVVHRVVDASRAASHARVVVRHGLRRAHIGEVRVDLHLPRFSAVPELPAPSRLGPVHERGVGVLRCRLRIPAVDRQRVFLILELRPPHVLQNRLNPDARPASIEGHNEKRMKASIRRVTGPCGTPVATRAVRRARPAEVIRPARRLVLDDHLADDWPTEPPSPPSGAHHRPR